MNARTGILGLLLLITAVLGLVLKWNDILTFLNPHGDWLNWRFVVASVVATNLITWFIMHELWRRAFAAHEQTKHERDNFESLLSLSEKERMTDVVTGIPNGAKLTADLDTFFSRRNPRMETQIILIDIKNFRRINREFGFLKGDALLRMIAQKIYHSMRRDDNMYKHPNAPNDNRSLWKTLYRRYPGGDEFIFLIEGDQSAAIGFVVRLVPVFKSLSKEAAALLKTEFPLSFHCAVAPLIKGDSARDVFTRVEDCYMRAAEGKADFTLCWWPTTFEHTLKDGDFRKALYVKAREEFEIMNL